MTIYLLHSQRHKCAKNIIYNISIFMIIITSIQVIVDGSNVYKRHGKMYKDKADPMSSDNIDNYI